MGMSSASTRHPIKTAQFPEPFEAFAEKSVTPNGFFTIGSPRPSCR